MKEADKVIFTVCRIGLLCLFQLYNIMLANYIGENEKAVRKHLTSKRKSLE